VKAVRSAGRPLKDSHVSLFFLVIRCLLSQIGRAPIHMAAFGGHMGVIRLLLASRSSPTPAMSDNCISAGRLAATMGHKGVSEMLLRQNENARNLQAPSARPFALRLRGGMVVRLPLI